MINLNQNTNQFKTISTELALEMLKRETAQELGIEIHPDMSARDAGRIGGNVTRKLIELGKSSLNNDIDPTQFQLNQTNQHNLRH